MERILKGIAIIFFSILCMLGFGHQAVYHFDFQWNAVFTVLGFLGLLLTLIPAKKK